MTFKLRSGYPAEHLVFGREEPGAFSPALPILAMLSPQTPRLKAAQCSRPSLLLTSSPVPGVCLHPLEGLAEVLFRSWFPPTGITHLLLYIKCSTDFRIKNNNQKIEFKGPRVTPAHYHQSKGRRGQSPLTRRRVTE